MSEAEFERRQAATGAAGYQDDSVENGGATESEAAAPRAATTAQPSTTATPREGRGRGGRGKSAKPRRVQRMFALEEELDKKLWLYAIHVGKDRSDVVNDLLRPVVASMVLYDSRDRRSGRQSEPGPESEPGSE